MKTLANCNDLEFTQQTFKLAGKLKKYSEKIKEYIANNKTEDNNINYFDIISYICGDNINETMEICGALCFMSGEEFAALEPDENGDGDGIVAICDIFNSKRCMRFFTTALQLRKITEMLL